LSRILAERDKELYRGGYWQSVIRSCIEEDTGRGGSVVFLFFLLNSAFAKEIMDIISRVHLASVILLPKQLQYCTFFICFFYLSLSVLGMVVV
jgi:hypothetical protein